MAAFQTATVQSHLTMTFHADISSLPSSMRALRVHGFGDWDRWSLDQVDLPALHRDHVLVRVHASTISYVDLLLANGGYQVKPHLPMTPGTEFSGVVAAIGPDAQTDLAVGQRVAGTAFGGSWAEFVQTKAHQLVPLAETSDMHAAASLCITAATANYALTHRTSISPGDAVLVLGASGGVGLAAVQLASSRGATVIAGSSHGANAHLLADAGAHHCVDTARADWREQLKSLAPSGIDVVVDTLGDRWTEPAFRSLAWGGRHLVIGFAGGEIPTLKTNLPLLKGAAMIGVDIRQFGERQPQAAHANLSETAELLARGVIRTPIAARYTGAQWRQAITHAQERGVWGKVSMDWVF